MSCRYAQATVTRLETVAGVRSVNHAGGRRTKETNLVNRIVATLAAGFLVTGCAVETPPPTAAAINADEAIAAFVRDDPGSLGVHAYAWVAQAIAYRSGWDDPRVAHYLAEVFRQQNPDGGYGLEFAWDAFQDGTVNPADTTYAITLSDHVGPVFLNGWRAGVLEGWRVQQVVDLLLTFPRVRVPAGICVAYSTTAPDQELCVDNINTSAAWFLVEADRAGFDVPGLADVVDGVVDYERSALIDGEWWPYMSSTADTRQDWQHQATMVENMLTLDPEVGFRTLTAMTIERTAPTGWEQLAQIRLAPFACDALFERPSLDRAFDAELAARVGDPFYLGLMAFFAARSSHFCERRDWDF